MPEWVALRALYQECLSVRGVGIANRTILKETVKLLVQKGIHRAILLSWAVEVGYKKSSATSMLSRIFLSLGLRQRKTGAGRKPSAEIVRLAISARKWYGSQFRRRLRAAANVSEDDLRAEEMNNTHKDESLLTTSISSHSLTKHPEEASLTERGPVQ